MISVAITGASGFIGRALVPELARHHRLVLIERDAGKLRELFPQHVCADYAGLPAALEGCDVLVHLAVVQSDSGAAPTEFDAFNRAFAQKLATTAKDIGVRRIINAATIKTGDDAYSRSKLAGEAAITSIYGDDAIHLRLPPVYSDQFRGRLEVLNRLPRAMRAVAFQCLKTAWPTVHVETVCEAIAQSIDDPQAESRTIADDQSRNGLYTLFRGLIDFGFVSVVFLALWWLMLLVLIAVHLDSRGPALFLQERIGRDGRIFRCCKFRTMTVDTPQVGTHEADPARITRVGRVLRRTKLDELPQAWNVLLRQMSVLGPRPSLPGQTELIAERSRRKVLDVLPGITGLSQVNGIDMSEPVRLARADADYIARRSAVLDLNILLATAIGRGARDRVGIGPTGRQ